MSTLKEPYRIEGKKTMAYELAEQMRLDVARLDHLSRPAAAPAWSACGRRSTRWKRLAGGDSGAAAADGVGAGRELRADRPRVRAGRRAIGAVAERPTIADGLRVPKAVGDFLVLRAVRESGGTALAVTDEDMLRGMRRARLAPGHQCRSRGRRRAARGEDPPARRPDQARWTASCCSIPAGCSNTL